MKLLVIRHAIAVPHGTPGIREDDRPLTARGRARFERAARGLARIAPRPAVLLTSPLPRAFETAEIAARAWRRLRPTAEPALASGDVDQILETIAARRSRRTVAIVGHEPTLSEVLARLLGTTASERLELKKGGAALLDVPGALTGGGRLVWLMKPKLLRLLAGR